MGSVQPLGATVAGRDVDLRDFAAEIDAPGLGRIPSAGESHASMAHGTDCPDSLTILQFEEGRGVYQGG
jgi:hypothetical protein